MRPPERRGSLNSSCHLANEFIDLCGGVSNVSCEIEGFRSATISLSFAFDSRGAHRGCNPGHGNSQLRRPRYERLKGIACKIPVAAYTPRSDTPCYGGFLMLQDLRFALRRRRVSVSSRSLLRGMLRPSAHVRCTRDCAASRIVPNQWSCYSCEQALSQTVSQNRTSRA
jgi:hypothetical protein